MRKYPFFLLFCVTLLLFIPKPTLALSAEAALDPPVDWAWLVRQAQSDKETITLPNDITRDDGEPGLAPEKSVKIIGGQYRLVNARVDQGTVLFEDVLFEGINGFEEEDGGAALTLRGKGTVVVLSGMSRAAGGHSGPDGMRGGDGIVLTDDGQGVMLRGDASASGGVGCLFGGAGIRVLGCSGSALATDNAIMTGGAGTAQGGCGIEAPACCKLTLSGLASASGGPSPYDGGCGMDSHVCGQCGLRAQVLLCDHATLSGGVGEAGGAALQATRAGTEARREAPDVVLSGECMLLGAAGDTAGAALRADACAIAFDGSPTLVSGFYRLKEAPVMKLTNCVFTGGIDKVQRHEGEKSEVYPARDVPQIILSALGQQSGRYTPKTIEDGLNTRELSGRLDGHAVEKGSVSQASLDGKGLLITMWNRTLETKLRFREYLMPDGTGGLRLVCIAVTSLEWPTVRSSVAALRKLQKEGFTQLAYSNAEPVYNERVIDIPALLEAIDAYQRPVRSVFLGTADDAVIFLLEDEALVYQEGLMEQIVRPLEAADAENGM